MRHPHAWSIVDEVECIQWIREVLNIWLPFQYQEYSKALRFSREWSEFLEMPII
jgi:hypothetical protein